MRHPVSTPALLRGCWEVSGAAVEAGFVGFSGLPATPEDAEPGASEDADSVRMIAAAISGASVDVSGPRRAVARVVGEADDGLAKTLVARPAEGDAALLAGCVGDGSDTGFRGELIVACEARALVTEFGENLRGIDATGARKGHDDRAVRMGRDGVLDGGGDLDDLRDKGCEDAHESEDGVSLRISLLRSGAACWCRSEAREEIGDGATAAVGMPCEESGEALGSEVSSALGCWEARQEGESDGRVDVGEEDGGARPEAFEERAQLIGEHDARCDEIIAGSDESTQCTGFIARRSQWGEAVSVSAQEVGEQVGIAAITLGGGSTVARARCLHGVRVNRDDDVARFDQRIDEQARRSLDRDPSTRRGSEALETAAQIGETSGGMRGRPLTTDLSLSVENAHSVLALCPIDSHQHPIHRIPPGEAAKSIRAGRSCRSLIDRRSVGHHPKRALHPVAGRDLPASSRARVSQGPFTGERRWRSSTKHGSHGALLPYEPYTMRTRHGAKVHQ